VDIYRDIAEDPVFVESARRIEPDARRWDEIMDGVCWAISRNPSEFPEVRKGSNLRLVLTDAYPGIPALRILFLQESVDRCVLLDVSIVKDAEQVTVTGE